MLNFGLVDKVRKAPPPSQPGLDKGRDTIIKVLEHLCPDGQGAEIGTFNGTFAGDILERTNVSKLFCVDPYKAYDDFHDSINQMDLDAIFAQAQRFLARFPNRVGFIREFSVDAAKDVPDGSLDFVYIDGNHQCKFVLQDMNAWWPKLKPGGFLMGDDAVDTWEEGRNADGDLEIVLQRDEQGNVTLYGHYGVFNALRQFTENNNLGYVLTETQYVVPKPLSSY